MPRGTRRRKDVVLLLPSPTSSSVDAPGQGSKPAVGSTNMYAGGHIDPPGSSSSAAGASYGHGAHDCQSASARLDVLLYAQRMAWVERGQIIDIEAFMTPDMREEWFRRSVPYYQSNQGIQPPIQATAPSPQPYPAGPSASSSSAPLLPPVTALTETKGALASATAAEDVHLSASPSIPGGSRKRRLSPSPSSEHWKHRKREALLEAERAAEGAEADGEEPLRAGLGPDVVSIPSFSITPAPPPGQSGSKKAGESGESDKAAILQSASYWNSLLIQARRARGPQWDYNTQTFQVDQRSEDYYTHMGKLNPKYAEKEDGDDGDEDEGPKGVDGSAAEDSKPVMGGPSSANDRRPGSSSGAPHRSGSTSGPLPQPDHALHRSGSSSSNMQRTGSRPGGGQSLPLESPRSAVPGLPHNDRGPGSAGSTPGGPPHMVGSNGPIPPGHGVSSQADGAAPHGGGGGQMPMPPPQPMPSGGAAPPVQQQYGFSAAQLQGLMQQAQASGVNPAVLLAQVQAQARQNLSAAQAAGAIGSSSTGGRSASDSGRPSSQGKGAPGQPQPFGNMDYSKVQNQLNGRQFPGGAPQQMQQQGGSNGINPALLAQMAGGGGGPGGQGGFMGQPGGQAPRGYAPGQGMPGQGQWSFGSN